MEPAPATRSLVEEIVGCGYSDRALDLIDWPVALSTSVAFRAVGSQTLGIPHSSQRFDFLRAGR
jgi:hypothetical protein